MNVENVKVVKLLLTLSFALLVTACSSAEDKQLALGEQVYTKNCKVCHAQGINGAPILGNKKMWSTRKDQGIETLVSHASNGFGLMPAKGGNTDLQDADLRAAITFMLSKVN